MSIAIAIAITIAYLHEVQVLSSIPCQVVSVPRSGLWIPDSLRNLDLSGCVSVKGLDHLQTETRKKEKKENEAFQVRGS